MTPGSKLAVAVLLCAISARGATINVASYGDGLPSLANATAAYNAASTGDTVLFPLNGSATWTNSLIVSKAISIDGNGTVLSGGSTGLIGLIQIRDLTSTNLLRVTGFTFDLHDFNGGYGIYGVYLDLAQLRIDHNVFTNGGPYQLDLYGCKGVIDHNWFRNGYQALMFQGGISRSQQDASWDAITPGTAGALFIEDNHFVIDTNVTGNFGGLSDASDGGRFVYRHNSVDITQDPQTATQSGFQNHGNVDAPMDYWEHDLTYAGRSPSLIEFYNNTVAAKKLSRLYGSRGGSLLIYSNTVTSGGGLNPILYLREEENTASGYNFNPSRTTWPAEDQIHNSFFWSNTSNGILMESDPTNYVYVADNSVFIQQNRDFWLHAPQATGGREIFTGTPGASASYPGDGTNYTALGTMIFTNSGPNAYYPYTPYTYPHPLAGGTNSPATPPPSGGGGGGGTRIRGSATIH